MRGAGRLAGRGFKPPIPQDGGKSYDPFELLQFFGDLPVAPILTPINDNFSWSVDADPADPRDCSRYPSSPYCGELPFSPGQPFHYRPEIRSNGCETCIYVYPVILWLMATPQVICYRDPNCDKPAPPPDGGDIASIKPPRYNENVEPDRYKSPECAERESIINIWMNFPNDINATILQQKIDSLSNDINITNIKLGKPIRSARIEQSDRGTLFSTGNGLNTRQARSRRGDSFTIISVGLSWLEAGFFDDYPPASFFSWSPGPCPNMPSLKPPPPSGDDDDRDDRKRREREKKRGKKMCCNVCSDAADNTAVLLREIKAIKKALGTGKLEKALNAAVGIGDGSVTAIVNLIAKRLGTNTYPVEVPQSLLTGVKGGDDILKVQSLTDYMYWLTNQLDALIGEFPIDIEIKDGDPLKKGDQKINIKIDNVAEAIAEIYGLTFKNSVNQEVELNMLLRLALEVMQTKNAAIVAQEYSRGNAEFLGYEGNTKGREIDYNFDITDVNVSKKNQNKAISLESLLQNSKAWLVGWENNDKETVVGFLRKLMFSAGIIKAVFFRNKKQTKELAKNIDGMVEDGKVKEKEWDDFVKDIKDPNSIYNKDSVEKPDIKEDKTKL